MKKFLNQITRHGIIVVIMHGHPEALQAALKCVPVCRAFPDRAAKLRYAPAVVGREYCVIGLAANQKCCRNLTWLQYS